MMIRRCDFTLAAVFVAALCMASCEQTISPKGYIGATDVTAPRVRITGPPSMSVVKDSLVLTFEAVELFGLQRPDIGIDGHSLYGLLHQDGNRFTFRGDVAFRSGVSTVSVSARDEAGNTGTATVRLTFRQTLGHPVAGYDVEAIAPDHNGNLWCACLEGLVQLHGSTVNPYPPGFTISRPYLRAVAVDSRNRVWLDYRERYTSGYPRLIVYNGSAVIGEYYYPNVPGNQYADFFRFQCDALDTLWLCYRGGYATFKDSVWHYGTIPSTVLDLAIDGNNIKWFATVGGVYRFDGLNWTLFNSSNSSLPPGPVACVAADPTGRVWVAIQRSEHSVSVGRYDGQAWTVSPPFVTDGQAYDCACDADGTLWVGASGYLIRHDGTKVLREYSIEIPDAVVSDASGNIWAATSYGVYRVNPDGW